MATQLHVPKLGVTMTEGSLVEWLVADGGAVVAGQPLYVLETDKTDTEIDSPASGTLRTIGVEGETYCVGELIAEIA